ncbi:hypothetical protein HanXRQr2_Chr09g0407041 [Helianthus annuus]|uniref:Uncharacterized protein n=1 Tax=Helianthus annuus TaxID=4232 RepID=A0A9K3N9M6_HELAN|nr:hypothetical protein HanXRQr2_Chr09g0407041 [Helianthus annuus]KAJ0894785.1 hypothetical protein HanPSC8_Chr09g0392911 [Helianthus annuus]
MRAATAGECPDDEIFRSVTVIDICVRCREDDEVQICSCGLKEEGGGWLQWGRSGG